MFEEELRAEIRGTYDQQSELLRWKLVLVAAAGAADLGLNTTTTRPFAPVLLCAIPLICAYVDLVYCHLTLRVYFLGTFLRYYRDAPAGYRMLEAYVWAVSQPTRIHAFAFELWAVSGSTVVLSTVLLVFGLCVRAWGGLFGLTAPPRSWPLYVGSGALGVGVSAALVLGMRIHRENIRESAARIAGITDERQLPQYPGDPGGASSGASAD
jgi:hypothetical protein